MCRASWLLEHGESILHDRAFAYHHNNTKYALQRRLENADTCSDDETMLTMLAVTTIDVSRIPMVVVIADLAVLNWRACSSRTVS